MSLFVFVHFISLRIKRTCKGRQNQENQRHGTGKVQCAEPALYPGLHVL